MRPRPPPPGFVDLAAHVPGLRVAMGYHAAGNFTGAPLPGYGAHAAWLATDAADALALALDDLAPLGLIVHDAYRPHRATRAMAAWARANGQEHLLQGYISERSRHSRGTAVDVGLLDAAGAPLDMGTAWDTFTEASHTRSAEGAVLERRLLLREVMLRRGFDDYRREWWHFELIIADDRPFLDVPYGADEGEAI